MQQLAIFASGSGTNAENIIVNFQNEPLIRISCICTNRADAYVIERAKRFDIPHLVFDRDDFYHRTTVTDYLQDKGTDWIILAGFLWLVPHSLIDRYPGRIINIHPALLPKYGGKGMYGHHVHQAVIDAGETHSGITIHYIDHEYDRGNIIFQAKCPVKPGDTAESLAARIHDLEYEHFPRVIKEEVLRSIPL
ncbi:MAG TPA: phosphoribosylglycinamide formyltransferase [Bacteroidales bacterium]|nr:phosphoribosylglycinamide formyltransferase [Bacteroidales bacterium]